MDASAKRRSEGREPAAKRPCNEAWFDAERCSVAELAALCGQENAGLELCTRVEKKVPIYSCAALARELQEDRRRLQREWIHVLRDGAGIVVLEGALAPNAVDAASEEFRAIIADEQKHKAKGDHFAPPGANDRIWNAQEKLCCRAPEVFARYFAGPWIDAISEAWLGPCYQVSAQVNQVRPGGKCQAVHRDYHLGFMTDAEASRFPRHCHELLSPLLTLQGAVAHVDSPIEAGTTKVLPNSQRFPQGYVAWRRDDFKAYFEEHFVQLPLKKGDMVFFNPALFHAAGTNVTEATQRLVNLLQVSSAFGRSMESLDRARMAKALFPALRTLELSAEEQRRAVAACAEGYAFPTNLDRDPPAPGLMSPYTQAALVHEALADGSSPAALEQSLQAQAERQRP